LYDVAGHPRLRAPKSYHKKGKNVAKLDTLSAIDWTACELIAQIKRLIDFAHAQRQQHNP
jgi:hypothetical protein